MNFVPGNKLGFYEITASIGAGGMGEVYRARDTKLDRDVALKILPVSFAADPDRLMRFEREAKTLASLNHPNIAAIYGIEETGDTRALVMELVEGEDLSERIARGPIAFDEALPIARQVAEALEAAHEAGIVHRDLKPANIKVRDDGTVKVLDFGLAKAMDPMASSSSPDAANSPTMTSPALTQMGVILGTAGYMAPEQAKGRAVDRRADIWAFGVVLYEMLAGRRAFEGEDVSTTLAAVLMREPEWSALPSNLAPALQRLLHRCLERDPRQRLRDIGEARIALAADGEAPGSAPATGPASLRRATPASRLRQIAWPVASAIVAGLATWLVTQPEPVTLRRVEFSVPLPADANARRGPGAGVALSPDGELLVFVGDPVAKRASMLYLRHLDGVDVIPLAGTEGGFAPFFSPDSRWIAFFTDTHLMRMPVAGGRPSPITEKGRYSRATWMPDDTIVLGTSLVYSTGGLDRVPASGGTPSPFTTPDNGKTFHHLPHGLPDGRHVLFSIHNESGGKLAVSSLDSGTYRTLGLDGSGPRYVAPGRLLFARDGTLFQAPFDIDRLEITGPESSLLPDAEVDVFGQGMALAYLDVDAAGNLAYLPSRTSELSRVAWLDDSGKESSTGLEPARYTYVRMAPDGKRFVVAMDNTSEGRRRIRVVDTLRGLPLDLEADGLRPIWGPGNTIVFTTWRALERVPADNSQASSILHATPQVLEGNSQSQLLPQDWSPDGRLLFASNGPDNRGAINRDLSVLEPGTEPRVLLDSPADEFNGRISPDGRWLAYESTTSGTTRVYVRPFDSPGGTRTVSDEGGSQPAWSSDGRALYFLQDGAMMKAAVQASPFTVSAATELFRLPGPALAFDTAPNGRFLVALGPPRNGDEVRVVLGWASPNRER